MIARRRAPYALSLRAMTTLDYAPEREVSQERARQVVDAVKPPRLNFAGRCLYCLERDCRSPECEALYERSRWVVCPECDGREGDEASSIRCGWCTFGVVEIAPMEAELP
jgi:hypothetical protein